MSSSGGTKLCQCNLCSQYTTRDSITNGIVQGVMLSRGQWTSHQRAYKTWLTTQPERVPDQQGKFADAILEATLDPSNNSDALLTPRLTDFPPAKPHGRGKNTELHGEPVGQNVSEIQGALLFILAQLKLNFKTLRRH